MSRLGLLGVAEPVKNDREASEICANSEESVPPSVLSPARDTDRAGANPPGTDTSGGTMERARWTDERLDERMTAIDNRFDHLTEDIRSLREEMRAGFADVRAQFAAVRSELAGIRAESAEIRAEVAGVYTALLAHQRQMMQFLTAFMVALLGLVGAEVFGL